VSEGNRLSYNIEFDADEESLVDAIGDAIISSKPQIHTMLNESITEAFTNSVNAAIQDMGKIKLDVEIATDYGREVSERARENAPVVDTHDTVGDLLSKTASIADEYDMSSVVSTTVGVIMSQIAGYLNNNAPEMAASILASPASSVIVQSARHGDLSSLLGMLEKINKRAEDWGSISELPRDVKEDMIATMSDLGLSVVEDAISTDDGKSDIMTIGELMNIMGKGVKDPTEDISKILQTEVAVAVREGMVTIAQYSPIMESQDKYDMEMVKQFLEKEIVPSLESLLSRDRARLGAKFGEDLTRKPLVETPVYSTIVDDMIKGVKKTDEDILPKRSRLPRSDVSEANMKKIVEGLNNVVDALLKMGEDETAREVSKVVSDIQTLDKDMIDFVRSGESG